MATHPIDLPSGKRGVFFDDAEIDRSFHHEVVRTKSEYWVLHTWEVRDGQRLNEAWRLLSHMIARRMLEKLDLDPPESSQSAAAHDVRQEVDQLKQDAEIR